MYVIGIERVCYLFTVYGDDDVKPYIFPKEGLNKKFWLKWSPYLKKRGNLELKEPFQQKYETRVSLVEAGENSQINEEIKSMMDLIENFITRKHGSHKRAFICPVCGQEAEYKNKRIRERFTKKVAVLLDFVQTASTKPLLQKTFVARVRFMFFTSRWKHWNTIRSCRLKGLGYCYSKHISLA